MNVRDFDLSEKGIIRNRHRVTKRENSIFLREISWAMKTQKAKIYIDSFFNDVYGIGRHISRYCPPKHESYERCGMLIGSQYRRDYYLSYKDYDEQSRCDCCGKPTYGKTLCNKCMKEVEQKTITEMCINRLGLGR